MRSNLLGVVQHALKQGEALIAFRFLALQVIGPFSILIVFPERILGNNISELPDHLPVFRCLPNIENFNFLHCLIRKIALT